MRNEAANRISGCLLGGAVGDALGAPIEFMGLDEIRRRFGPDGLLEFTPGYVGGIGKITDDTQMTLFTAEGILRGRARWAVRGICHLPSVVHAAYMRWLVTQGEKANPAYARGAEPPDGWLITN